MFLVMDLWGPKCDAVDSESTKTSNNKLASVSCLHAAMLWIEKPVVEIGLWHVFGNVPLGSEM